MTCVSLRPWGVCASLLCVMAMLAACGSAGARSGPDVVLHWYAGPDRADVQALASACTDKAGGQYSIEVEPLPDDQDRRRTVLLQRLLGDDTSMDLISLDDAFTAEFADAQVLAPVPDELAEKTVEEGFPTAVDAARYRGHLVAVPWWLDPVLLWYRPSAAERAGFSMDDRLTWDKLFDAAERINVQVPIDDGRGQGIAPLVNALIAQGGDDLVRGTGRDAQLGVDGPAGKKAAELLRAYHRKGLGEGPTDEAAEQFADPSGGFMIAPVSAVSDPALASIAGDIDWAPLPVSDQTDIAPVSGYHLAVPLYAPHSRESFEAIECLTSADVMADMMTRSGHSAASPAAYEKAGDDYPWADVTREAVDTGVAVPASPYWHLIHEAIGDTWLPLSEISASTPHDSQQRIEDLLAGDRP